MASHRWLIGALVAGLVAFGLGVVGLAQYPPASHEPLDIVYNALQLFVLGSDPLQQQGNAPLPLSLQVARFLAPATTVYALVEALRTLWQAERLRRRVARLRGRTVVCGNDAVSLALARILHAAGTTVVRIEPGTGTAEDPDGITVLGGDAQDKATLEAAGVVGASRLYACEAATGSTAAVALAAARLRADRPGPRMSVYAQVFDDDLVEALRVRQLGAARQRGVAVDFFSIDDTAARILVATPQVAHARTLAIVGAGSFGRATLRALIRTPLPEGATRAVTVHSDAPGKIDELVDRFRPADRGTTVRAVPTDEPIQNSELVVVCHHDDETTLSTALRLQRSPGLRVIACLRRSDPFAQALAGTDRLTIFGILEAACHPETIENDAILGRAARAIHRNYVQNCQTAGDTPTTNPSMRDWEDLPPYLKESNFAQAEHIGVKLAQLPAILTTNPPPQPFAFTDDEVLKLAKLEHTRWMQERQAAGFTWGPVRDNHHHPDLVDWPNLPDDSRVKDIQAVRHLPELLGNAGLHITRI